MAAQQSFKDKTTLWFLTKLLSLYFGIEKYLLKIKQINYPEHQFILAMWHCHQFMTYGIKDKEKYYSLISASNDGEIIAKAADTLGIKSIRGSSKRQGASASLAILDKLKEGNSTGITVDGPRGPKGKVKEGIVQIASLSGVPIVPVAWYSKDKNFREVNTWDRFVIVTGPCKTVALYGDPINIPKDLSKDEIKQWCVKIEEKMNLLEKDLKENYDKYFQQ